MIEITSDPTYDRVLAVAFAIVAVTCVAAALVPTPYGRFASKRWGIELDPRLGWLLMELPATVSFLFFYLRGPRRLETVPLVFFAVWLIHYANRGFVFPALMRVPRGGRSSFSVVVVLVGWVVTSIHGYLNATMFATLGSHYTEAWLTDPRFLVGIAVYYAGFAGNIAADRTLRNLRTKDEVARGEAVYRIPRGGLYRWVTSPSYLMELVAWSGFVVATWSVGALFVWAISVANLVPRALQTHRWYRERFEDYPPERRALIPFLL